MTTEQIIGLALVGFVSFAVGVVCYVLGYDAGSDE